MSENQNQNLSFGQLEAMRELQSGTQPASALARIQADSSRPTPRVRNRPIDVGDLDPEAEVQVLPPNTYLNSPVPTSDSSAYLFNQQLPSVLLKHEKVEHRIMLFLKAQGKSNREVAQYMGYSDPQVSQIVRQPWFMIGLKELLEEAGQDIVKRVLEGSALDSVITLIAIRDNEKTPPAVKANVCNSLLDRWLGKPIARVEVERKESPLKQNDKIDAELPELDAMEEELKRKLGMLEK